MSEKGYFLRGDDGLFQSRRARKGDYEKVIEVKLSDGTRGFMFQSRRARKGDYERNGMDKFTGVVVCFNLDAREKGIMRMNTKSKCTTPASFNLDAREKGIMSSWRKKKLSCSPCFNLDAREKGIMSGTGVTEIASVKTVSISTREKRGL